MKHIWTNNDNDDNDDNDNHDDNDSNHLSMNGSCQAGGRGRLRGAALADPVHVRY